MSVPLPSAGVSMGDVTVHFEPSGVTVAVASGALLLDAARHAGVAIDAPCGGIGRCGRCRVLVRGAVSPLTDDENTLLSEEDIEAGIRLACRARAVGDVEVSAAPALGTIRVVERSALPRPEVEPPAVRGITAADPEEPLLGVAVDVGTTTLAVVLVDLRNGDELAHASALNPQATYGADVMSRVSAAMAGSAAALQAGVVGEVERLVLSLLESVGAAATHVRDMTVVANTVMRALLLAEDATSLSAAPYTGAPVAAVATTATAIGMRSIEAPVFVAPGISAFIGGDVVAGLLVAQPEDGLFVDLGTNGEIVLRSAGRVIAASAAAGPALEGASIEAGMRAEPGAIERVRLHGDTLVTETIDGEPARGLCGSGLLDLVAALLDAGVLDTSGRLCDEGEHALVSRVRDRDDQRVFTVSESGGVVLTQRDVRDLQLAKGAIRTAIDMVLERAGVDTGDIRDVVFAGGFGLYVSGETLARIGMIPAEWRGRLRYVGNAALAGAIALLVDSDARSRAEVGAFGTETIDLASEPDFNGRFVAALDFP